MSTTSLLSIVFKKSGPKSFVHFITNRCNARCSFCFIDFDDESSQVSTFEANLKEIKLATANLPKTIVNVNLTGGEPFIVKNIADIALHYLAYSHIHSIYITTNGFYEDRIREFVVKVKSKLRAEQKVYLSISLDGPELVHDSLRKVPGLFKRAIQSYRLIESIGDHQVEPHISITVTKDNHRQCLDFYDWLCEQGIFNIGITLERSQGVHEAQVFDFERVVSTYEELSRRILKRELRSQKSFYAFCLGIKNQVMHELVIGSARKSGVRTPCSAGKDFFVVDANLNVKNCEPQGRLMGSLKEMSLQKILGTKNNRAYYRQNNINERCDCSYECAKTVNILTNWRYLWKALAFALKAKLGPNR